jgi:hypothetical protein
MSNEGDCSIRVCGCLSGLINARMGRMKRQLRLTSLSRPQKTHADAGELGGLKGGKARVAKVVCRNIACVIHELYEVWLEPQIWGQTVPA